MAGARGGRRGPTTAVTVALALHGALALMLALSVPGLSTRPADDSAAIHLDLSHLTPTPGPAGSRRTAGTQTRSLPPIAPRQVPPSLPPPASPSLATAAPPSPAPTAGATSPESGAASGKGEPDLRGLLRNALACGGGLGRLTSEERAACARRLAETRGADLPHVETVPAIKRAYYDAVLEKKEHDRFGAQDEMKRMQAARGLVGARSKGIDMNIGYHCTFKVGAGAEAANYAAGRKIGFPPCPIRPPGAEPTPP